MCCFDKTGTLTSEDLVLEGVAGVGVAHEGPSRDGDSALTAPAVVVEEKGVEAHWALERAGALPDATVEVLVGCHGLVNIDDAIIGETMERVALAGLGWALGRNDAVTEVAGPRRRRVQVLKRFAFASSLARMATIVEVKEEQGRGARGGGTRVMVLAKGAPETMAPRFAELPVLYEASYKHYTRQGARVLALGYKQLGTENVSKLKAKTREECESSLTFAGLVVFHCPSMAHDNARPWLLSFCPSLLHCVAACTRQSSPATSTFPWYLMLHI